MSGHSKWSQIKRQKGATDAKRGQIFTKIGREITIAARDGGGDPEANPRLRLAIQKARDHNMPVDNIDRAIKRAVGGSESADLVEMTIEGYGPGGIAILLRALTDNRNRTLSEIRNVFSRGNANLGESGCVTWVFEPKGLIVAETRGDAEALALAAIDAGADDVKVEGSTVEIYTSPEDLEAVRRGVEKLQVEVSSADLSMIPQNVIRLDDRAALQALKLLDKLEEIDGVQHVFTNADFPDAVVDSYRAGIHAG